MQNKSYALAETSMFICMFAEGKVSKQGNDMIPEMATEVPQ